MARTPNDTELPAHALRSVSTAMETKSLQTLTGLVAGIVADASLHDMEIQLLSTWLSAHQEVTRSWPGMAIYQWVSEVCADGVVTDAERAHLLANLTAMAATDFAATGSAQAEPLQLPIDDSVALEFAGAGIVHTGTFVYGTRSKCERLSEALGARPLSGITKAAKILVVGTRVTPSWRTEAYGQKIIDAVNLQQAGHPIKIVSEQRWFAAAQTAGAV